MRDTLAYESPMIRRERETLIMREHLRGRAPTSRPCCAGFVETIRPLPPPAGTAKTHQQGFSQSGRGHGGDKRGRGERSHGPFLFPVFCHPLSFSVCVSMEKRRGDWCC